MSRATETIDADIGIIGAGPAGTAAAIHLGQLGVKPVVLVDRHDFPRDKTCGSGVSPKGRLAVQTPLLDFLVGAGQRPMMKNAIGKLMAQM